MEVFDAIGDESDPASILQKLQPSQVSILNDYLIMWKRNVSDVLDRLRDTIPGEGMLGEVHYWRDLSRVLTALQEEVKDPKVELAIQIMVMKASNDKNNDALMQDVTNFTKEKSRVLKGAKEARWNNKYMRIIEKPVKQIEQSSNLIDIQIIIVALLRSLKNIYDNSNFYKEARIVSFIDRLLATIKIKIKQRLNLQIAIYMGIKAHEEFQEHVE